jgi:hypothetical protein
MAVYLLYSYLYIRKSTRQLPINILQVRTTQPYSDAESN